MSRNPLAATGHLADCYCNGTGMRLEKVVVLNEGDTLEVSDERNVWLHITVEDINYGGDLVSLLIELPCRQPQPPRPEKAKREP